MFLAFVSRAWVESLLKYALSTLAIADANGVIDRRDEDFPVPNFSGAGRRGEHGDDFLHSRSGSEQLDFYFRQEIHLIFLSAVDLLMALLPSVTPRVNDRHAV